MFGDRRCLGCRLRNVGGPGILWSRWRGAAVKRNNPVVCYRVLLASTEPTYLSSKRDHKSASAAYDCSSPTWASAWASASPLRGLCEENHRLHGVCALTKMMKEMQVLYLGRGVAPLLKPLSIYGPDWAFDPWPGWFELG